MDFGTDNLRAFAAVPAQFGEGAQGRFFEHVEPLVDIIILFSRFVDSLRHG